MIDAKDEAAAEEFKLPATPPKAAQRFTIIGLGLTAVWLAVLLAYWLTEPAAFEGLKANEMGDFFAGAFAPLALMWLVLGFFQQGTELRHSGAALWLQGRELQHSVEQQRELVNVTREQFALEGSMARPILKGRANYFDRGLGSDKHDLVEFYVENHGEICTDIAFDCDYLENRSPRNALSRGGVAGVSFRKPKEDEGPIRVVVTYKDMRGTPGKGVFDITVEGDNLMVVEQNAST